MWKKELEILATETGIEISRCHFSSGTNKWKKLKDRLLAYNNQPGAKPLTGIQIVLDLIGATKTMKGLKMKAKFDSASHVKKTGGKIDEC